MLENDILRFFIILIGFVLFVACVGKLVDVWLEDRKDKRKYQLLEPIEKETDNGTVEDDSPGN
jgi:hypothetical protein